MIPNPLNLADGAQTLQAMGFEITIERRKVGDLELSTGRLVACDPLYMPETDFFDQALPRGSFPVYLVLATMREELGVAYAVLELDETRATRWEIAHVAGEDPSHWRDPDRSGFHVGSSVAALMDVAAADVLLDVVQYAEDEDDFPRTLRRELRRNRRNSTAVGYTDFLLDTRTDHNMVAFEVDDGIYTTYFGFDADGRVVSAVVDFELLDYTFTPFGLR